MRELVGEGSLPPQIANGENYCGVGVKKYLIYIYKHFIYKIKKTVNAFMCRLKYKAYN